MFQIPPPTKFDLRFSIAGTPIRVSPMFWLIAILLGSTGGLAQIPIWVVVVFVSILPAIFEAIRQRNQKSGPVEPAKSETHPF